MASAKAPLVRMALVRMALSQADAQEAQEAVRAGLRSAMRVLQVCHKGSMGWRGGGQGCERADMMAWVA